MSRRWLPYHCGPPRHVVHAVSCVCPWLYDDRGTGGKIQSLDLLLDLLVGHAYLLNGLHVCRVDVRMLAFQELLLQHHALVQINDQLVELVAPLGCPDDDLYTRPTCGMECGFPTTILLVEEANHVLLRRLAQRDEAEVGSLAFECMSDYLRSLANDQLAPDACEAAIARQTCEISCGESGSKG